MHTRLFQMLEYNSIVIYFLVVLTIKINFFYVKKKKTKKHFFVTVRQRNIFIPLRPHIDFFIKHVFTATIVRFMDIHTRTKKGHSHFYFPYTLTS